MAAAPEALTGKGIVGQMILHRWPRQGWVRGRVDVRAAGFSPGVRFDRGSAVCVGDVSTFLDVHSNGSGPPGRWGMLYPA